VNKARVTLPETLFCCDPVWGCYINTNSTDKCDTPDSSMQNDNDIKVIIEDGNEVVIFDEYLALKGSEGWCLTICGQFVG
ncbi:hypothetical protein Tco_0219798, partial [Tanacetum coccineum]